MTKITLIVGDESNDGHGRKESFTIQTNVSRKDFLKAFEKGSKKLGFDLRDECEGYQESAISEGAVDSLVANGIVNKDRMTLSSNGKVVIEEDSTWDHGFMMLFTEIVRLGNPKITFGESKSENIHIGGYGLFY
tara:strand:- start:341 stop:742 length:402 start_codon:yes stop_codon:yes gene_type:complete